MLMRIFATIIIGAALTPASAMASPTCDQLFAAPRIATFEQQLASIGEAGSFWEGYNVAGEALVLIDQSENANCALVLKNGKALVKLATASAFQLATAAYDIYPSYQTIYPDELTNFFKAQGIKAALVMNLGVNIFDLGFPSYKTFLLGGDGAAWIYTATHEATHAIVQLPVLRHQPSPYSWPAWDKQPQRSEIVTKCYNLNANVAALAKSEHDALLSGIKIGRVFGRADLVGAAVHDFQRLRRQRYAALSTVRVSSAFASAGVTCSDAEAVMELEEGVADYVAVQSLLATKLMTDDQVLEFLTTDVNEPFYQFGSMQLLLLSWKLGSDMKDAVDAIAKSESPDGGIGAALNKAWPLPN